MAVSSARDRDLRTPFRPRGGQPHDPSASQGGQVGDGAANTGVPTAARFLRRRKAGRYTNAAHRIGARSTFRAGGRARTPAGWISDTRPLRLGRFRSVRRAACRPETGETANPQPCSARHVPRMSMRWLSVRQVVRFVVDELPESGCIGRPPTPSVKSAALPVATPPLCPPLCPRGRRRDGYFRHRTMNFGATCSRFGAAAKDSPPAPPPGRPQVTSIEIRGARTAQPRGHRCRRAEAPKYGLGWRSGTPTQTRTRQTHVTNGEFSWHMDGDGPPVGGAPRDRRGVPTRHVAEPARFPQGCSDARREPGGVLALGADREGPRR